MAGASHHGTLNGPDGTEAALAAGRAQHGPRAPAPRAGEPCWIDLFTSDDVRADRFWAGTLGWDVVAHPGAEYLADGRPISSRTAQRCPGAERGWLCYFAVDDVPAAADHAGGLGADTATREHPVLGSTTLVTGPEGGTFGVAALPGGWGG
nr:VOC family protein [Saccharopolyspora sp. HNM0983]